jgi:hypothetical protein
MLNQYPYPEYEGKRSIAVGILLIPFLVYIFPLENFQFLLNFFQFYKSFRFYKL